MLLAWLLFLVSCQVDSVCEEFYQCNSEKVLEHAVFCSNDATTRLIQKMKHTISSAQWPNYLQQTHTIKYTVANTTDDSLQNLFALRNDKVWSKSAIRWVILCRKPYFHFTIPVIIEEKNSISKGSWEFLTSAIARHDSLKDNILQNFLLHLCNTSNAVEDVIEIFTLVAKTSIELYWLNMPNANELCHAIIQYLSQRLEDNTNIQAQTWHIYSELVQRLASVSSFIGSRIAVWYQSKMSSQEKEEMLLSMSSVAKKRAKSEDVSYFMTWIPIFGELLELPLLAQNTRVALHVALNEKLVSVSKKFVDKIFSLAANQNAELPLDYYLDSVNGMHFAQNAYSMCVHTLLSHGNEVEEYAKTCFLQFISNPSSVQQLGLVCDVISVRSELFKLYGKQVIQHFYDNKYNHFGYVVLVPLGSLLVLNFSKKLLAFFISSLEAAATIHPITNQYKWQLLYVPFTFITFR